MGQVHWPFSLPLPFSNIFKFSLASWGPLYDLSLHTSCLYSKGRFWSADFKSNRPKTNLLWGQNNMNVFQNHGGWWKRWVWRSSLISFHILHILNWKSMWSNGVTLKFMLIFLTSLIISVYWLLLYIVSWDSTVHGQPFKRLTKGSNGYPLMGHPS